jgi:hypothetical protein
MGKNPLRRIVKRLWHDQLSYSDVLECGHVIYVAVRAFEWRDGKAVNLELTAKRRRCQECANGMDAMARSRDWTSGAHLLTPALQTGTYRLGRGVSRLPAAFRPCHEVRHVTENPLSKTSLSGKAEAGERFRPQSSAIRSLSPKNFASGELRTSAPETDHKPNCDDPLVKVPQLYRDCAELLSLPPKKPSHKTLPFPKDRRA